MTGVVVVFDVLLAVTTAALLRLAPRVWRNEAGLTADVPIATWIWGTAAWRGFVRASTLVFPVCWALVAPAFVLGTVTGAAWAEAVGLTLGGAGGLFLFVGGAAVGLFNRPRWLVAPHLRQQPGMLAELLGAPVPQTPPPGTAGYGT